MCVGKCSADSLPVCASKVHVKRMGVFCHNDNGPLGGSMPKCAGWGVWGVGQPVGEGSHGKCVVQ